MKPISSEQEKQDRKWEEELFREEPDVDFTWKVMQKLDYVSMEEPHAKVPWEAAKAPQSKWIYQTGIAAAAAVLIAGGAWAVWDRTTEESAQSPVNAVNIPPLPDIPVPEILRYANLADDYKRLQPLGLVLNPNINIDDQGYKLKIENVLVDGSQIILMLQQTAPDGSGIYALNSRVDDIHIMDINGKDVATLAHDTRPNSGSLDKLVFQLHRDIPDEVIVRGEFGHLNVGQGFNFETKSYTDKKVTVDWSFQFKLDMTKVKAMSVETLMNTPYTTPEGLELDMTHLVQTPNGTRVDLEVNLNDQLRAKAGEGWEKNMDILYHIEIPGTNEYRIFNGSRPNARYAKFRYRDWSQVSEGGPLKLSETWDPSIVTLNAENMRFVLDGYTMPVKEEKTMEVDLDKSKKDVNFYTFASLEQLGDRIDIYAFNYQNAQQLDYQPQGKSDNNAPLVLEGEGVFQNEFYGDQWVATDPEGREYAVEVMGIREAPNSKEEYVVKDLKFIVHGFNKDSGTKLTLKRTTVHRDFRDVDWSITLANYPIMPWDKQ
ncbi:hypothetical protein ACN9MH_05815 [Paenibacillus silvae]|jgi:hypothetical protein|uniref:hypothetical protein n=1 Tax=Paenibacillus silvae TaxID=1325358 RepID=UPI0025A0F4DA|nr:hypothetical protein [Paenibacillus silvae]MDM5279524.1 hypothetical protein [Paenibacillus silvae]